MNILSGEGILSDASEKGSSLKEKNLLPLRVHNYSRTSMARTSLGPWRFVPEMGSSSH